MKTSIRTIAAIAIALAAAGCGGKSDQQPGNSTEAGNQAAAKDPIGPPIPPKPNPPKSEIEIKQFHDTFEKAMTDIPPELRIAFQDVWNCELKKNAARPADQKITLDANSVRDLTAKLKADPSIAKTCT